MTFLHRVWKPVSALTGAVTGALAGRKPFPDSGPQPRSLVLWPRATRRNPAGNPAKPADVVQMSMTPAEAEQVIAAIKARRTD